MPVFLTKLKPTLMATSLFLSLIAGTSIVQAEAVKITIANFGEHPTLLQSIDGFKKGMSESGYTEGKDVVYEVSHTNFDPSLIPAMIAKLQAQNPALMVTLTTPVSQTAQNALKGGKLPQVFVAVTDPVAAGLVPAWDKGGPGITGSSDLQSGAAIMDLAHKILPQSKTLAVPYNPGEANDLASLKMLEQAGAAAGFKVIGLGIDNVNDIQPRIASLKGKADIIYVTTSNMLHTAMPAISAAAREIGVPVLTVDESAVKEGLAVGTVSVNYDWVGSSAGKIAASILKGTDPATIPVSVPSLSDHTTVVSTKALKNFGLDVPPTLKDCNCLVD